MLSQNSPYLSELFNTPVSMNCRSVWILFIFLVFASCQEEKKEEVKETLPLSFKKEIIKKEDPACQQKEQNCSVISLEVVKAVGNRAVAAEINTILQEHLVEMIAAEEAPKIADLQELTNFFIDNYTQAVQDFAEEPAWEAYVNENIYLRNEDLTSVGITAEIFTGGAHGYKTLHFLNFDPKTGNLYSKEELFTPGFLGLAEKEFRKQQNIPAEDNINSTGFSFENDVFELPENIGFSENSIILIYNSYEIAPYSAGDVYLEIPMKEARPFLKIQ